MDVEVREKDKSERPVETVDQRLIRIKQSLIDSTVLYGAIFAVITMIVSYYPGSGADYNFDFYTDILSVLCVFGVYILRDKIPIGFKSVFLIFVILSFVSTDILNHGLIATDKDLLVIVPFFSILIFSPRRTVAIYALSIGMFLVIGYLYQIEFLDPVDYSEERLTDMQSWISSAILITIVSTVIAIFTHKYNQTTSDLIHDLDKRNNELRERERKLKEAQKFAKLGYWDFDLITSELEWSDELFNVFELERMPSDKLYEAYRSRFHPDDIHILDTVMETVMTQDDPINFDHRIVMDDGSIKYIRGHIEAERNDKGLVTRLMGIGQDVSDSKKAEIVLRNREQLLSTITENFPRSYLSVIDSDMNIHFTGGSEFKTMGINPDDFLGLNIKETFMPYGEDIYNTVKQAYEKTLSGEDQVFEINLGGQFQLYKTIPLVEPDGEINSLLVVVENITERVIAEQTIKKNLEEKEVMLQEIHHRVKNNLAVVSGLLELQSYRLEHPETVEIMNKSTNRILSIAKVHEMLYQSADFTNISFSRYIEELSKIILTTMNKDDKDIQFKSDIGVETININQGVPLGIIFNELITNSVKYGFNNSDDNVISIIVSQNGDDTIKVKYSDNGVGIPDFNDEIRSGLGITLIENLLDQLDAKYEYETKSGFNISFEFTPFISSNSSPITHKN